MFVVFDLNFFVGFMPQPEHGGESGAFLGALFATGYMFPLIELTEIVAGALLLSNRFVPLALRLRGQSGSPSGTSASAGRW